MSHEASSHPGSGRPGPSSHAAPAPVSLTPTDGWHCQHLFFRFDRAALAQFTLSQLDAGRAAFATILDPATDGSPTRVQAGIVMGP